MGLLGLWERISRNGTDGLSSEAHRKTRLLNQCAVIASFSLVGFTFGYWTNPKKFAFPLIANFTVGLLQLLVLKLVALRARTLATGLFLFLCNAHIAAVSYFVGPEVGFQYYFFCFATVVFVVTPRGNWFLYPFAAASLAGFFYFTFIMRSSSALVDIDPMVALFTRAITIITTFSTLILLGYLFDADTRRAEQDLELEHDRSEQLLLNILPRSISDRLKGGHRSIADGFAEVSVLFADIVGFTELSSRMPPAELVNVLNDVFSRFDELAERLKLEKIKTIGDAYMVAAGLPEPDTKHAAHAVEMALRMREALEELNQTKGYGLAIRIGVHSGPVVAGVIGKKKFIYDLWGDTVNTASRMESHGSKGLVHISEATAELVKGLFTLEPRGTIQVKGKGDMVTYFVDRTRPHAEDKS
ncbi:MAG: adenylate/guanylate cyclase domain-containing protein [Polyangiaceae bacterium]